MLDSMKYGTYIFFAAFCLIGGTFVYFFVPETKDKTLEELDIYFGGDETGIAAADRARMQRINAQLGLERVDRPEELKGPVSETEEKGRHQVADSNGSGDE